MSDSVRPHRRQPTRLPHPWDSPGKNTGVGCHFCLQHMKVKSEVAQLLSCVQPSATPWTAAYQAPPSMGFSRQEYWSVVPLPSPTGKNAQIALFIHKQYSMADSQQNQSAKGPNSALCSKEICPGSHWWTYWVLELVSSSRCMSLFHQRKA